MGLFQLEWKSRAAPATSVPVSALEVKSVSLVLDSLRTRIEPKGEMRSQPTGFVPTRIEPKGEMRSH